MDYFQTTARRNMCLRSLTPNSRVASRRETPLRFHGCCFRSRRTLKQTSKASFSTSFISIGTDITPASMLQPKCNCNIATSPLRNQNLTKPPTPMTSAEVQRQMRFFAHICGNSLGQLHVDRFSSYRRPCTQAAWGRLAPGSKAMVPFRPTYLTPEIAEISKVS